jgi:hypothetical protein
MIVLRPAHVILQDERIEIVMHARTLKIKQFLCTSPKHDIWLSTCEPKLKFVLSALEGWQTAIQYTKKWNFTFFVPHLSYYYSPFLSYLMVCFFSFPLFSRTFTLSLFILSYFASSNLSSARHLALSSLVSSYYRDPSFSSSCFPCPSFSFLLISSLPLPFLLPE